jgi:DNA polymerase elongation subunit (family B)
MPVSCDEIDLDVFGDDVFGDGEEEIEKTAAAAMAKDEPPVNFTASAICDIETGPGPWEEIERFYTPLPKLGEFDPKTVKLGRMKDQAKIDAKIEEAREKHRAAIEDYEEAEAKNKAAFLAEAAKKAFTCEVLAIGYLTPGNPPLYTITGDGKSEPQTLADFWRAYKSIHDQNAQMVGFNFLGFDLPVLIQRSWHHGIAIPEDVEACVLAHDRRSWPKTFVDLMPIFTCKVYGKGQFASLDDIAKFFGLPGKNGSGAEFAGLWATDRKKACEYLRNDLLMTYEVARKVRVFP